MKDSLRIDIFELEETFVGVDVLTCSTWIDKVKSECSCGEDDNYRSFLP